MSGYPDLALNAIVRITHHDAIEEQLAEMCRRLMAVCARRGSGRRGLVRLGVLKPEARRAYQESVPAIVNGCRKDLTVGIWVTVG